VLPSIVTPPTSVSTGSAESGEIVCAPVPIENAIESAPTVQPVPDLAAIKQRQQATWASGDFAVIGNTLQIAFRHGVGPIASDVPACTNRIPGIHD